MCVCMYAHVCWLGPYRPCLPGTFSVLVLNVLHPERAQSRTSRRADHSAELPEREKGTERETSLVKILYSLLLTFSYPEVPGTQLF